LQKASLWKFTYKGTEFCHSEITNLYILQVEAPELIWHKKQQLLRLFYTHNSLPIDI